MRAYNGTLAGNVAKSGSLVVGDAVQLPYIQDFSDASTFSLLSTIDVDGDGNTWQFNADNGVAFLPGQPFDTTNDWLVLPKFHFTADRLYKISYRDYCEMAGNYPYKIGAFVGTSASADALTTAIVPVHQISQPETDICENYFKVAADGDYYIGIQVSGYDIQSIQADSIRVETGPKLTAPDAVTGLKVVAGEKGAASAVVSFTTPTKDIQGNALEQLTKVEIERDGKVVGTIHNPGAGSANSFSDLGMTKHTNHIYKVTAYNANGQGLSATDTVYVGIDTPSVPGAFTMKMNGDKANLSWNVPAVGENGGWTDPDNMQYIMMRSDTLLIGKGIKKTALSDNVPNTGAQGWLYYLLAAYNSVGMSKPAVSNAGVKGAPYVLPFRETFPGGQLSHFWGAINYNSQDWGASWSGDTDDQNGDNGSIGFGGNGGRAGSGSKLMSGKISLDGANNPVLEFYYDHRSEGATDSTYRHPIKVGVIVNGADTTYLKELAPIYFYQLNLSNPWNFVRIPLKDYVNSEYVQLVFDAQMDETTRSAIDNVVVRDYKDNDLQTTVSAPASAASGDTIAVVAKVKNIGAKTADGYTLELRQNGKTIGSQRMGTLDADSVATYTFKVPVSTLQSQFRLTTFVDYAVDEDLSNNASDTASVSVTLPDYPAPTALAADEAGNKVALSWKAPDYSSYAKTTVESAEDYEPFAISNMGDWTVVDADEKATRNDIEVDWETVSYPHVGEKFAWIVMNPDSAKISTSSWWGGSNGWQPVSGKQYFASICSSDGSCDDWLISGELTGDAQTISFYQHGYYGGETYEVLYSTTDKSTSSFISLGTQTSASDWTQVSFELPAGAKYVAIRNLGGSAGKFFFVDDIRLHEKKWAGVLQLQAYNVYRDGVKIGQSQSASYTDGEALAGSHQYQVTALYSLGESASASIVTGGISTGIGAATAVCKAYVVARYTVDGRRVNASQRGVVIERLSDGTTRKVIR